MKITWNLLLVTWSVLCITTLLACQGPQKPQERATEESITPAEQIRRRNAQLLDGFVTEERIRKDLIGKTIYAFGPEEGGDRSVEAAWVVYEGEIKEFIVESVDGDDSVREILAGIVFDDAPKSNERMEGAVRIRYEKQAGEWKFASVRRATDSMEYRK